MISTSAEIGRSPIAIEPVGKPGRARAVAHAADEPAEEERARDRVRPGEMDGDRAGEAARHRVRRQPRCWLRRVIPARMKRLQPPQPRRGEVAGDAAHAQAIGAVGGHLDLEHGIVEPDRAGEGGTDREVRRQLDDAFAILG